MSKLQKAKSRLGRGLSSLISVSELPVQVEAAPAPATDTAAPPTGDRPSATSASAIAPAPAAPNEIALDLISPNPHQPRRQFNEASLGELAASLKTNGLIQPVIVRKTEDGLYQLIAGERRLRAAKLAGLSAVPAIVREADAFSQAQLALVENIHREDLNPIDRAAAYRTLIDQLGLTQAELATRLGEDRSSVANFLRLLELAEPVKNMVRDSRLSLGHAKILAGVADVLEQERLANLVLNQGLSVRNLERAMQSRGEEKPAKPQAAPGSAHLQELEKSFARQLGMRVQIRAAGSSKGKGRIIIHYASLDQFDSIQERLGVAVDSE